MPIQPLDMSFRPTLSLAARPTQLLRALTIPGAELDIDSTDDPAKRKGTRGQ